ncbi:MAG: hypothetical protein Q8L73_05125 [Methylotenera sp.]|nr:hypothetical protein [Methylotenera sp.]
MVSLVVELVGGMLVSLHWTLLMPGGIDGVGAGSDIVPHAAFNFSSANGGFLLYPNKSNNNQMQSVYSK